MRSPCPQVPVPRKLFGNYSTLLIKFRLQRYVGELQQKGKYFYPTLDESVLPGLLHTQHPPGFNELGIFLVGAVRNTGQNHAWQEPLTFNLINQDFIEIIAGTGSWLTYINLHKNINDNVSRVHYIKYIDIWFLVSTFFIFLSLVEFAIVNSIQRGNYPVSRKTVKTLYGLLCFCSYRPRGKDRFLSDFITKYFLENNKTLQFFLRKQR